MKMHLAWIRVTAAAAMTIVTFGGQLAAGQSQYGPYAATPQSPAVAPYGIAPATQPPAYPSTGYPTAAAPIYPSTAQPQYQPPQYQSPTSYDYLAKRPKRNANPAAPSHDNRAPATESLPAPGPAMGVDADTSAQPSALPYPATDAASGYYGTDGACTGSGIDAYMQDCDDGSQWFGGVYGLYMTRSNPSYRRYTVGVDTGVTGVPYYPVASDTENESSCGFLDPDLRAGVEVRLGCTFGIGDSCDCGGSGCGGGGYGNACGGDSCGCQPCCTPCCQQMFAWEVAWWGIDRDVQEQYVDGPLTATFRYYGMVNYAGLEYDDGGGAQSVNTFYNYQIPITGTGDGTGGERVVSQRVRTNFWCQNLELNMLRLPLYTGGCGCDCAEPFSLTGLCGVRYFRFGDDFEFDTEWSNGSFDGWGNGTNELFHQIQMDNQLLGFQLGANMNYCVASRWNVFWDTNFGLYNNHINAYQRMYNPINGPATFVQDGRNATVLASTDVVSFLGEMRIGGGYLFTNHLRGILAYRALGITGVALAPDQIKPEYSNWADTALINSGGSIVIHGIQAGFECNY